MSRAGENPRHDQSKADGSRPNLEVPERAKRRRFSPECKLRILQEADRSSPGEIGTLLRREGLYSSHLAVWRRHREEGALRALSQKRSRKAQRTPEQIELERLRRENAQLRERLRQVELIVAAQKKSRGPGAGTRRGERLNAVAALRTQGVSARDACDALAVARATYYRTRRPKPRRRERPSRPTPSRALSPNARGCSTCSTTSASSTAHRPRWVATLLDDDATYLCSTRTMYRILAGARARGDGTGAGI